MSVSFYMDEHVHQAITQSLRKRGVDVLTARENGCQEVLDSLIMDRATELGRVLISYDHHMLQEATFRQRTGIAFTGLIYGHKQDIPEQMGRWIEALSLIGIAGEAHNYARQVKYLPNPF
ncbi:MAG: DUF5615 family PIN-like protein [Armatimonadetes bacterium]|nr:DUF5615 family PIN-like protein [Armatimonadota bacterium]